MITDILLSVALVILIIVMLGSAGSFSAVMRYSRWAEVRHNGWVVVGFLVSFAGVIFGFFGLLVLWW